MFEIHAGGKSVGTTLQFEVWKEAKVDAVEAFTLGGRICEAVSGRDSKLGLGEGAEVESLQVSEVRVVEVFQLGPERSQTNS